MSLYRKISPLCVGIDFGQLMSRISICNNKGYCIDVIFSDGEDSLPSLVHFRGRCIENVSIGKNARHYQLIDSQNLFSSIKNLMKNNNWVNDKELVQKFTLKDKIKNKNIILSPAYIAREIIAHLLEKLRLSSLDFGEESLGNIKKAVIGIPANATKKYIKNIYKASILAGLGLGGFDDNKKIIINNIGQPSGIYLLEEPISAAIAYDYEYNKFKYLPGGSNKYILIYSLFDGSFNSTILSQNLDKTKTEPYTVIASNEIQNFGIEDFEKIIVDICSVKFKQQSGIDIFNLKTEQIGTSPKSLKVAQQKIKVYSSNVIQNFSKNIKNELIEIPELLKDGDYNIHDFKTEILKTDFEKGSINLISKINACVMKTLDDAFLRKRDINKVLFVGSDTKHSWITNSVKELFSSNKDITILISDRLDSLISRGAAIYGTFSGCLNSQELKVKSIEKLNTDKLDSFSNQPSSKIIQNQMNDLPSKNEESPIDLKNVIEDQKRIKEGIQNIERLINKSLNDRKTNNLTNNKNITNCLPNIFPAKVVDNPDQSPSKPEATDRKQVFVCYSHKDSNWLHQLKTHFKPIERNYNIVFWDDSRIAPGFKWKQEIDEGIRASNIAVLLISANFFASDFIADYELPQIIEQAQSEGAMICSLILSPSRFSRDPSLSAYQAANDPNRPLSSLNEYEQEKVLDNFTKTVEGILLGEEMDR
jgi:molecular chaperone DnaK (HSP70)